jgi:hypothetical protein
MAMTIDYLDVLLGNLDGDSSDFSSLSVRYDKNCKTIRVKYDFNQGKIKNVKMITSGENWLNIFKDFTPDQVSFETVKELLSRPSVKLRKDLKSYADQFHDDFVYEFLICIQAANAHNPKFPPAVKPRGGSPYPLNYENMWEIKNTAKQLYAYLLNLKKQPEKYAEKLSWLKKKYDLAEKDFKNLSKATMKIIQKEFGIYLAVESHQNFYRKYINTPDKSFQRIKKDRRIQAGDTPYIKKIFSNQ